VDESGIIKKSYVDAQYIVPQKCIHTSDARYSQINRDRSVVVCGDVLE
jgi:hypothetical protein